METVSIVIGGIGLFLLGMILMTDGMKALAGDSLRETLSKFTGGIFRSIASGAAVTAVVQSSSATTLMTIGFVSAGLITFTQSIGIVLGANLGSTSTGWIVSFIGLKVSVTSFAFPLIGIGALLKFFTEGKWAAQGMVFAGFGLLFLGIGTLQNGMSGVAESFTLESFNEGTFIQMLALVVVGLVMTVIMQSSSTAMVITLTALAAEALSFEQAAILVVGQNIGTTLKAYVATIGGTVQARRTAMTHILFNVLVALIAFIFLPAIVAFIKWLGSFLHYDDPAVSLAFFSTLIYTLGIIVVIPFLSYFVLLISRIVPEKDNKLTKYLDDSVLTVTPVAVEATRRTLIRIMKAIVIAAKELNEGKILTSSIQKQLEETELALNETRQFVSRMGNQAFSNTEKEYFQHIALIHAIDHLERLLKAIREPGYIEYVTSDDLTLQLSENMNKLFTTIANDLTYDQHGDLVDIVKMNSLSIADMRRSSRKEIIERTALQKADIDATIQTVNTLQWIDRIVYHLWRGLHHLNACLEATYNVKNGE
ncbi:MAG TPA: Na/Pi cotransporter family protein [Bacillus bacterium]|nr:Na/Pi cotransporter family protein [Bacillus sp. (in: firmicutes)]